MINFFPIFKYTFFILFLTEKLRMKLEQFVEKDILNEDQNFPFTIRLSETLQGVIPEGVNRQVFFRKLVQLYFLLKNSVFYQKILKHVGFNTDLHFDLEDFKANFNEKFFGNHVTEKKIKENDPELINEISRLKENNALLIAGFKIFWQVFTELSQTIENKNIEKNDFYGLPHFPNDIDIATLDKINNMINGVTKNG